jgi:hypothetical protein
MADGPPPDSGSYPAGPAQPTREMLMELRLAPAEHYDAAMEILERVDDAPGPTEAYLWAIAHALLGLLRHQMTTD